MARLPTVRPKTIVSDTAPLPVIGRVWNAFGAHHIQRAVDSDDWINQSNCRSYITTGGERVSVNYDDSPQARCP